MRFVSLIFDYDLDKMVRSGRIWAKQGYEGKEHILEYSAASIATVLHHNPKIPYIIWTDDARALERAIKNYDVDITNLDIIDATSIIAHWKQNEYCFWPLSKFIATMMLDDEPTIKLDNDLTCLKSCDELFQHDGALVWKFERRCSQGRDYWGEKHAALNALGTIDFNIYNTGVFALLGESKRYAHQIPLYCQALVDVDVSNVARFPEDVNARTRTWSVSDQTANCFVLWKYGIHVHETHEWFLHHCYGKSKQSCIDAAKFLKK